MKKTLSSLFVLAIVLFLSSCASVKKVPYFQNIDQVSRHLKGFMMRISCQKTC